MRIADSRMLCMMTNALLVAAIAQGAETRSVTLIYTAIIQSIPENCETIDLWVPVAQNTDGQVVSDIRVIYPEDGSIAVEPEHGNKMWHKRFTAPFESDFVDGHLGVQIEFDIHRKEIVVEAAKSLSDTRPEPPGDLFGKYLESNALIPIQLDPVVEVAIELQLRDQPPIVAARRVYDWLIEEFTYDWRAPGAGEGDVRWACDSKTGDCSDYHSMFLALCRTAGIPADHEFGYPIRVRGTSGRIPSYHCWARFYVDGVGWIPIDASEADKNPDLREYNFGSQSPNLFKFTHGRDVTLAPPQQGPPLNYFVHPYVETDGAPHPDVNYTVYFKEIPPID